MITMLNSHTAIRKKPRLIVELVGPAGAGKTTLSRMLCQRDEKILVGAEIELRKAEQIPVFLSNVPSLLPVFLQQGRYSRCFTWDEIKALVYLKGWPRLLRKQARNNTTTILLDHGPIFKLATLNAFGPEKLGKHAFEKWWDCMLEEWTSTLDIVVWVDAPDTILKQRINTRVQRHVVKGKSKLEAFQFLARYRLSYAEILAKLGAMEEGPTLIQFDTHQSSIEEIVEKVLAAFNLKSHESWSQAHGEKTAWR